jgi:hypothetical protein
MDEIADMIRDKILMEQFVDRVIEMISETMGDRLGEIDYRIREGRDNP